MNYKKYNLKTTKIVSAIIMITVVLITFVRIWFSAEISDEAYAMAEPYIVSKGAIPFVNNWSQMPGFGLLMAPICRFFCVVTRGTEGMMIYMRFVAFMLTLLTSCFVYMALKKHIEDKRNILLYVTPAIIPFMNIVVFRGDRLALLLMWLSGIYLTLACIEKGRKSIGYSILAGLFSALAALCYGQWLVCCFFTVCFLLIIELKQKNGLYKTCGYCISGMLTAVIVVIYLVGQSSFSEFVRGIQFLLSDVAYFKLADRGIGSVGFEKFISFFRSTARVFLKASIVSIAVSTSIVYMFSIAYKHLNQRQKILLLLILESIGVIILFCIRFRHNNDMNISYYTFLMLYFMVPIYFHFIMEARRICLFMLLFIWFPSGILIISTSISTYASVLSRTLLLSNGVFLAILFAGMACRETFEVMPINILRYLPEFFTVFIAGAILFNIYVYIYRDGEINTLTTRITSGVYKGLYTTDERAKQLVEIEKIIREYTDEKDNVLFMESVPMGYLMTDAMPCTPCTWDQSLYAYGFNDDSIYMDYFELTQSIPTKIIYIDHGRNECMSIEMEDYKFNKFVLDNYALIYDNKKIQSRLMIFKKIKIYKKG